MPHLALSLLAAMLLAEPAGSQDDLETLVQEAHEAATASLQQSEDLHRHIQTRDSGIAGSKNFTVLAVKAGGFLARDVLAEAERLRTELSLEWIGAEIPNGVEVTHIHIEVDEQKDEGFTLLAGPGRRFSGDNRMWLTTSRKRAAGSTLAHEITHVVLAARFPQGMPVWANEGIASRSDDPARAANRKSLLRDVLRQRKVPSLAKVLELNSMPSSDLLSYAVSASLAEYLLDQKDDKPGLLEFVEDAKTQGWDAALAAHYGIANVKTLQKQWQTWLAEQMAVTESSREHDLSR